VSMSPFNNAEGNTGIDDLSPLPAEYPILALAYLQRREALDLAPALGLEANE
jgi:hypothetical protein